MMLGEKAFASIGELSGQLCAMSRKIWENPEGPYQEKIASDTCAAFLEAEGFRSSGDASACRPRCVRSGVPDIR